jgi:hypothetical protein
MDKPKTKNRRFREANRRFCEARRDFLRHAGGFLLGAVFIPWEGLLKLSEPLRKPPAGISHKEARHYTAGNHLAG